MNIVLRTLIIDDSEDDALLIVHQLKKGGYDLIWERIETADEMSTCLKEKAWDIILCDYKMPKFDGLEALSILQETGLDIPFLLISGTVGEDIAVEAMKAGASDYIMKDNLHRLLPAIERELRDAAIRLERKELELKEQLAEQERQDNLIFFQSMDKINKTLRMTPNIDDTLNDLLDIVLSIFNCDRAWLMYPCDLDTAYWKIALEKTKPEYLDININNVDIPVEPEIKELFRILLASDNPSQFLPPNAAERFKFKSQLTLALHPKIGKPWVLGLHQCSELREWTTQEQKLFLEIGRRLSDSLTNLLIFRNLKESEEKYRTLIQRINAAVIVFNQDGKVLAANQVAQELVGIGEEQMLNKSVNDVVWNFYTEDGSSLSGSDHPVNRVIKTKKIIRNLILKITRPDLTNETWVLVNADPVIDKSNQIEQVIVTFIDVTERKLQEEKVRKLNRLNILLSNTNEVIVRTQNIHTMFDEVCRIAIEHGGFIVSWIGVVNNQGKIDIISHATDNAKDIYPVLEANLNKPDNKNCLIKKALKEAKIVYTNNLEEEKENSVLLEKILQFGIKSSIALPLKVLGKVYGVFCLYSKEPNLFDKDELKLLKELTMDISFALEYKKHESGVQQQLQFTNALNKIASIIISSDKSDVILERTAAILGETLNVDHSLIFDVNFDDEKIIGLCEWLNPVDSKITSSINQYSFNLLQESTGRIRNTLKPLISYSNNADQVLISEGSDKIFHQQMNIKSLIWYPFFYYGSGYYLIVLDTTIADHLWTESEIEFLNSVSKQLNIAIEKIKLLDQRTKAEEEVKANELKFRTVADFTYDWEFWLSTNNEIVYMSPSCERITGYTINEFVNEVQLLSKVIHPDDLKIYKEHIETEYKPRTNEQVEELEFRITHKNGSVKYIHHICRPIYDENYKYLGRRVSNRDFTAKKIAEDALKESELRIRALVNSIPDIIFLISREGVCIDFHSDQESELLPKQPIIGKHIRDILPKDVVIQTLDKIGELINFGKPQIYEFNVIKKNHSKVYENRLTLAGDNLILSIVRDITEKKESEENIRKLSRVVEQSPAAIVITDVNGIIEYVNKKFTEVTGYTYDEVKKENPRILKSGFMSKESYKEMWQTILAGKEWFGEFHNKKKSGELYWEAASISPIYDSKGRISNFLAIKQDITEQKRMTSELIEAKNKAEEMNKVKSYFFANMSHELRTPFVGILGFAELLSESLQDEELKNYALQIVKSGKRLTDTLNKILNVTRLEYDKFELNIKNIEINKFIEETAKLYSQTAKANGNTIKLDLDFDILTIKTDEKLLEEILNNLISNAVKYTQNGLIKISSRRVCINDQDNLEIVVSDTGVGIPKDLQNIVWHEFRQVSEGYNRSFEGTGLGLAITKKCAELLGGVILLESEMNKGSVFSFYLPLINEENLIQTDSQAENTKEQIKNNRNKEHKTKLLYVEDDPIALEYIAIVLKKLYDVFTASTYDSAIELVTKNQFDVLMLDINLGRGKNGIELMQQIRKIDAYKNKPIVAITAYAAEADKTEFLSKGFSSYLSKPFTSAELKDLLSGLIN